MQDTQCNYYMYWYTYCMLWPIDLVQLTWSLHVTNVVSGLPSSVHFMFRLHEAFSACWDLYLHFADSFNQSPTKSVVNSEKKILSNGSYGQWIRMCSKRFSSSAGVKSPSLSARETSQEIGVKQFPDHKLQPLGLLWMLRHLVKWHPGVAEQFIWKHIR